MLFRHSETCLDNNNIIKRSELWEKFSHFMFVVSILITEITLKTLFLVVDLNHHNEYYNYEDEDCLPRKQYRDNAEIIN